MQDKQQRFSIRKLSIGVASVVIGFWLAGNAQTVNADSLVNEPSVNTVKTDNSHQNSDVITQNAIEKTSEITNTKSSPSETNSDATENNTVQTAVKTTNETSKVPTEPATTTNHNDVKTNETLTETQLVNNSDSNPHNTTDDNMDHIISSNNVTTSDDNRQVSKKTETAATNTTNELINSKSKLVNAETKPSSNIEDIKKNAAITIPSNDGRYTLYLSRNTWGNTEEGDQPLDILLSGSVVANDTVSISIPTEPIDYTMLEIPPLDNNYGNVSITRNGEIATVTYNFTTSSVINPIITIKADKGLARKSTPMSTTQPTVKNITWTVNNEQQESAELHIDVNPTWNPQFSLMDSNSQNDETLLKKMIPNYNATYNIDINETNGVFPSQDGVTSDMSSDQINSAINYGSIITIPMPKGYVLNEDATKKLWSKIDYGNKTTITQKGSNIIINVPQGNGGQAFEAKLGYRFIGQYDIDMPNEATTLKAEAPITIVQKLNADGSQIKTWTGPIVSQEFYGKNDTIPMGKFKMYPEGGYNPSYLLNNDQKQIVAYLGITNNTITSYKDHRSNFTFDFDKRLGVTELVTPKIEGVNNYTYTVTFADNTKDTKAIKPGESIESTAGKAITNIVISPDILEQDQGTDVWLPNNKFKYQKQKTANAFMAYGTISNSVQSGTNVDATFKFTGSMPQGNITHFLFSTTKITQTIISKEDLTASLINNGYQNKFNNNQSNIGYMSIYNANVNSLTKDIYEPTFYYVLPDGFSVHDFSDDYTKLLNFEPNNNNGVVGVPKISTFTVPTKEAGLSRQVVKIDYSGTGYTLNTDQGANDRIHLDSLPDVTNGTYQSMIYVVSPTTKLDATMYNADNTNNMTPDGIKFNPDWVEGNTSNLYYIGNSTFTINQVSGANAVSLAQGNGNVTFVNTGISNIYDSDKMHYAIRLINGSTENLTNVAVLINLPQASDSSFKFQLVDKIDNTGFKDYTFLYSTELGDLEKNSNKDGAKPDETGYVTADKVTDWSKIKSIIVKTPTLNKADNSNRLILTGIDPNFVNDAGKTGYISTGFYSDTTKPLINTAANKVKPGNITVIGEAQINLKIQYTDENGQVQTIDLPDLTTDYNLVKSNTMVTEQGAIDLANKNAASYIPASYYIASADLQSGGKTWQTNAEGGTPVFGGNVQYFYNGATVILQAHKYTSVDPNTDWPSTSTDADKVPLSEKITRTVNVSGLSSTVPSIEQNVNFTRNLLVDEETGKVIGYVDPTTGTNIFNVDNLNKAWVTPADHNWASWTNSNVPEGYYIESAKVGNDNYSAVTTDTSGIITGLKNVTVTLDMNSVTVNVICNKVNLNVTINHDTITNTYNGREQPASPDVISAITHTATSSNSNIPVPNIAQAIQAANLTSEDYSYTDAQGNVLSNVPTNAGNYRIILNQNGLDKLDKVAGGLTINYDPNTSYVNYTINKAEATANLEGHNSKKYDAQEVTNVQVTKDGNIKVTANVPGTTQSAYELQAGDYDWYGADGSKLASVPTNAGNYTIKLNDTGIANIKSHFGNGENINWAVDSITGSASYVINKATAIVTFDQPASQTVEYSKGTFNPDNFKPSISTNNQVTVNIPDGANLSADAGDFVFTKDGSSTTTAPTELGTYTVTLSEEGFKKLQSQTSNYDWVNDATGTFTVNPATNIPVTLTNVGDGQKVTYTSNEFTNDDINVDDYSVTLGNGQTYKLQKGDLEFVPNQDPTNVGTYTVQLSKQSKENIAKVDATHFSYNFDNAGTGSFEIQKAIPSVSFTGSGEKTYDGKPIEGYAPSLNVIAPGNHDVTLEAGIDYVWTKDGQTFTTAPSDAGDYNVSLTDAGIAKIKAVNADNLDWSNVTISQDATYKINKDDITISGTGSQTGTYTGKPQVVDPGNFPITLKPNGDGPVPTIPSGTLTSGDFVVKDKDGKPVDPTNVGDYTVYLTPEGIEKLKKLNPNYNWPTTDQKVGTLTVTPADMDVTLSGNDSKVSDGQPANVDLQTLLNSLSGDNLNKDGLTAHDFSWNTPDGKAPTNVGNYTITLNENGLKKLQENNSNYTVNVNGEFTYTITAASQKIEYVDSSGNVIKTIENIGTDSSNHGDKIDFDAKKNLPDGYELVDPDQANLEVTIENGVTKIKVRQIPSDDGTGSITPTPDKPDTNEVKPNVPNENTIVNKPNNTKPSPDETTSKTTKKQKRKHKSNQSKIRFKNSTTTVIKLNQSDVDKSSNTNNDTMSSNKPTVATSAKMTMLPQTGSQNDLMLIFAGLVFMSIGLTNLAIKRKKQ